jgi:uncharacterized repeat protein (TIGR02543 family)
VFYDLGGLLMKRLLSFILAFAVALSLLPALGLTAKAAETISYIDENGDPQTRADPTLITSGTTTLIAGWYYVSGTVSIGGTLTITGDVKIILTDDSHLQVTSTTADAGINVSSGSSLSIYAQSGGTGRLTAAAGGEWGGAGIGGGRYGSGGTVTINGGTITATGDHGAGIGGGYQGNGGAVTINGGAVTATGGRYGAGIGGGFQGDSGTVTITGGTVTATGGTYGAGIGGGDYNIGSNVTITGGTVTAMGGSWGGAGIGGGYQGDGGTVTITGGTVTATGGTYGDSYGGAGIGGGSGGGGGAGGDGGTVTISGGSVNAVGLNGADNIGKGHDGSSSGTLWIGYIDGSGDSQARDNPTLITSSTTTLAAGWYYVLGTVTISSTLTVSDDVHIILTDGSDLTVTGSLDNAGINVSAGNSLTIYAQSVGTGRLTATGGSYGAGIGGGYQAAGGKVTISGGTVTATGGGRGAGIGGGNEGDGGAVIVNCGIVFATGGEYSAAIGGGYHGVGGTFIITGGSVTATGGYGSAGIGGGDSGQGRDGGTVTVTGGTVTATGGQYAAGIGGGCYDNGGTVTIGGGMVTATSGGYGAGIGGGYQGSGGTVVITGGSVLAEGRNDAENIGKGFDSVSSGTLTDGSNPVRLNTLTIGNTPVGDITPVTAASIPNITYGVHDVVTDAAGKVYFYLPESAEAEISLTVGGAAYLSKYARDTQTQTKTLKLQLSGGVSISGTQKNNETLAANVTGAPGGATLTYAWYREGEGQIGSGGTYTTVTADAGKTITVKVTATEYYGELIGVTGAIGAASSGGGSYDTNYAVTFNSNGGSAVSPITVAVGSAVTRPADPIRAGYTFAGWYTDAELTIEYDFASKVTKNFTLYAKWIEVEAEPVTPDETDFPFDDVKTTDWFYDDVVWAWENGLMTGTSATKFSPLADTSRGMIVTILYRLAGEPAVSGGAAFSDVADGQYYSDAVSWASANGIVNGVGAYRFAPDAPITRQDLAAILLRYIRFANIEVYVTQEYRSFADEDQIADYAKNSIQTLNKLGIINGVGNDTINPRGNATRAEVAAVLRRFVAMVK